MEGANKEMYLCVGAIELAWQREINISISGSREENTNCRMDNGIEQYLYFFNGGQAKVKPPGQTQFLNKKNTVVFDRTPTAHYS